MAAQLTDPITSFRYIVDNVPSWRSQIADLTSYALKRYDDYASEYQRLVSQGRTRKQKTASISSIHGSEDFAVHRKPGSKTADVPGSGSLDPFEAGNRFILTQAQRRRRPGTSIRSNASGPKQQRSKKLVVIYYDSHLQEELDKLVKAFGTARNMLRKGKLSYTAAKGFALPSLGRRDNLIPNPLSRSIPSLSKATTEPNMVMVSPGVQGLFSQIDKEIERVQTWCEVAAHQAIRDGDVQSEMENSASKLDVVLAMANSAVETLEAEKTVIEVTNVSDTASMSGSVSSSQPTLHEMPSLDLAPTKLLSPAIERRGLQRPVLSNVQSEPNGHLLTGAIEVDDDDDTESSEVDLPINISNYRAASRRVAP